MAQSLPFISLMFVLPSIIAISLGNKPLAIHRAPSRFWLLLKLLTPFLQFQNFAQCYVQGHVAHMRDICVERRKFTLTKLILFETECSCCYSMISAANSFNNFPTISLKVFVDVSME